jgi:hypothetical protein
MRLARPRHHRHHCQRSHQAALVNACLELINMVATETLVAMESLRILVHLAGALDLLKLQQSNVKTAFLNGELPESKCMFMEQPKGFEDPKHRKAVWELLRGLYGMEEPECIWNQQLNDVFTAGWSFHGVSADNCLYYRCSATSFCIAVIHVDDLWVAGASIANVDDFKAKLGAE